MDTKDNRQDRKQFDLASIGRGALVAGTGAVLAYVSQNITGLHLDGWQATAVAISSILVNIARKWIENNTK